jgi:hypothetical protein
MITKTLLNQITGDEARGQADVPQNLHQRPSRIATGASRGAERLVGRLYAWLHADHIADQVLQAPIEFDEKVDGVARRARNRLTDSFGRCPAGSSVA